MLRLFGHPEISGEDVGAADLDAARLAARKLAPFVVHDAQGNAGERHADGARAALAVVGVGRDHPRFGHAVPFEDGVPGALGKSVERRFEQRRRSRHEKAHVRRRSAGQSRLGREGACRTSARP